MRKDQAEQHTFAQVHTNTSYPSVILAHSQYVKGVTCDDSGLHIDTPDQKALAYIQSTWPSSLPLIIVTLSPGCGSSEEQRTFWLVNSLTFGSPSQPGSATSQYPAGNPASGNVDYSEGSSSAGKDDNGNGVASPVSSAGPSSNAGSPRTTIHATVQQELSIGEAMPEIEIVWGKYSLTENGAPVGSNTPHPPSSPHSSQLPGAGGGGRGGIGGHGSSTTGKGIPDT